MSDDKEIKKIARKLIEDKAYLESLKTRLADGSATAIEKMLWHYAHGRPAQQLVLEAGTTLSDLVCASFQSKIAETVVDVESEVLEDDEDLV